ncbi:hypothetical protein ACIRSD_45040 [Streptomyces acidicola]|uniref:hypothetical protein n=1 Tax=Streptomyces acidicola TaxID=2596892 RepID=UPI0038231FED
MRFFVDGIGFRVSDLIKGEGAFIRCSTDHHNLLVLRAPVTFLHHTSWQVDDIDEVGLGAFAMLEGRPERYVWGLGRHYAQSNFFWYLKDPAGSFTEYSSDMDCIVDDQLWMPEDLEGACPGPVRLGVAATAVVHPSRRPRRHDDRQPPRSMTSSAVCPAGRPGIRLAAAPIIRGASVGPVPESASSRVPSLAPVTSSSPAVLSSPFPHYG